MVIKIGSMIAIWVIIDIILIIGVIIWGIIYYRKLKSIPEFERRTIVLAFGLSKFVDGHVIGFLKQVRKHKSGRKLVDYYPIDYSPEELDAMQEIPIKTVVANNVHVAPKDKHSRGFNIMYILPKHETEIMSEVEELPAEFQKGFMNTSQKERLSDVFFKGVRAGDEALEFMSVEVAKGQLSREGFLKIKSIYEAEREAKAKVQTEEKKETLR